MGWASDSSRAARVTPPRRTHASKAINWGMSPCRKNRRKREWAMRASNRFVSKGLANEPGAARFADRAGDESRIDDAGR